MEDGLPDRQTQPACWNMATRSVRRAPGSNPAAVPRHVPDSWWQGLFSTAIGKRWATYPANLCLFLAGVEFSDAGKDLGEAVH